jgi:hypothetical protein
MDTCRVTQQGGGWSVVLVLGGIAKAGGLLSQHAWGLSPSAVKLTPPRPHLFAAVVADDADVQPHLRALGREGHLPYRHELQPGGVEPGGLRGGGC